MNMKQNTQTPREFVKQTCTNPACGAEYDAPKKIRGTGVIGGGLCPDCLREARPAEKKACPICGTRFRVQAGHSRDTCSRDCQKVFTLRRKAAGVSGDAEALRRQADELLREKKEREAAEARAAQEAKKQAEAAQKAAEAERKKAEAAEAKKGAEIDRIIHDGKGSKLERLARAGQTVRRRRSAGTEAAAVAVAA